MAQSTRPATLKLAIKFFMESRWRLPQVTIERCMVRDGDDFSDVSGYCGQAGHLSHSHWYNAYDKCSLSPAWFNGNPPFSNPE